jgi:hypothetical protein
MSRSQLGARYDECLFCSVHLAGAVLHLADTALGGWAPTGSPDVHSRPSGVAAESQIDGNRPRFTSSVHVFNGS